MFLKYFVASLMILCATCCPEDDCSALLCVGPPDLALQVLENGNNVFDNGSYSLEDIVITDENSTKIILEIVEAQNGEPILLLTNIPWQIGANDYTLTLAGEKSAELKANIILSEGDGCCSGIEQLIGFSVNGREQNIDGGYFTISVR